VIAPALAGKLAPRAAVDAVVNARVAALADPDGDTLSRTQSPCRLPAPCR
jgi:indolepyruvate ferredoxin oxidoreductase beta subunit